jgi:hypothetical protein
LSIYGHVSLLLPPLFGLLPSLLHVVLVVLVVVIFVSLFGLGRFRY